jgi:hypothetical protein
MDGAGNRAVVRLSRVRCLERLISERSISHYVDRGIDPQAVLPTLLPEPAVA